MLTIVTALLALLPAAFASPQTKRYVSPAQQLIRGSYLEPEFYDVKFLSDGDACPCSNQTLCKPVTDKDRQEIFGFQVSTDDWSSYDWSILTTVVVANTKLIDPAMLCYAHAHDTRVIQLVDYSLNQLSNYTAQNEWVKQQVAYVVDRYLDGLNLDFESPVANNTRGVHDLTHLVDTLTRAMHQNIPTSQVTVDLAWSPDCIDGRCFDAKAISEACDFVYIMSYDLRSQIFDMNDCIASANSPLERVAAGVKNYTDVYGIPPHKIVLGVPWYEYDYTCINTTDPKVERCLIEPVPFSGAPCSDAAGNQIPFDVAQQRLKESTTGLVWNDRLKTWYFNYVDEKNQVHQVWMDNSEALSYKYKFARDAKLRGLGPWTFDFLNYTVPDSETKKIWEGMRVVLDVDRSEVYAADVMAYN